PRPHSESEPDAAADLESSDTQRDVAADTGGRARVETRVRPRITRYGADSDVWREIPADVRGDVESNVGRAVASDQCLSEFRRREARWQVEFDRPDEILRRVEDRRADREHDAHRPADRDHIERLHVNSQLATFQIVNGAIQVERSIAGD